MSIIINFIAISFVFSAVGGCDPEAVKRCQAPFHNAVQMSKAESNPDVARKEAIKACDEFKKATHCMKAAVKGCNEEVLKQYEAMSKFAEHSKCDVLFGKPDYVEASLAGVTAGSRLVLLLSGILALIYN